jgi:hypothetical protein
LPRHHFDLPDAAADFRIDFLHAWTHRMTFRLLTILGSSETRTNPAQSQNRDGRRMANASSRLGLTPVVKRHGSRTRQVSRLRLSGKPGFLQQGGYVTP